MLRVVFVFILFTCVATAKNIVILNSYHPNFLWTDQQNQAFIKTLKKQSTDKYDIYIEYMDTKRVNLSIEQEKRLLNLFLNKYKGIKVDSVIATDDNAINFLMKYRSVLFKNANIVFSGVNNLNILSRYPVKDITGVFERMTPRINFNLAKTINPDMKMLYLLGDDSVTFKVLKKIFETELKSIDVPYKFISSRYLDNIIEELNQAPEDSVIMTVMLASLFERDDRFIDMSKAFKRLSQSTTYPIVSTASVFNLGGNVLGGYNVDGIRQGELTAEILLEQYKTGRYVEPILKDTNSFIFDYNALKRFDIDLDLFNSIKNYKMLNQPKTFYENYKEIIIGVLIFVVVIVLVNIVVIIYSIKLRRSNEKLEEANENMILFMDSILEGVLISKDGRCIYANSEAANILKYDSKEELIGKNVLSFASPSAIEHIANRFKMDIAKAEEHFLRTKDDQNVGVLIMGRNIVIHNEVVRVSSFVDISESKRKDKLLFEQSKLASMGEMIGNIAHQWRQPLSVISTASTGIKIQKEMGMLNDKLFFESMDSILENTNYLSQTIDDFRNYIKGDKTIQEFNIEEPVERTIKLIKASLDFHNIKLITDFEEGLIVNSCQNELSQVLINIFNNAKDALLATSSDADKYIFVRIRKYDEDALIITIKDNAGGIPSTIIDKVFEPYFTTKDKKQGTGLGLYMSYNLARESLGGNIYASNSTYTHENKIYNGASFDIILPKEYDTCVN